MGKGISTSKLIALERKVWRSWCDKLAVFWGIDYENNVEGHIYNFADAFMNIDDIRFCVINEISFDKFMEWYDGVPYDKKKQNLSNFIKYGWIEKI
jgi:hypothetical protein